MESQAVLPQRTRAGAAVAAAMALQEELAVLES